MIELQPGDNFLSYNPKAWHCNAINSFQRFWALDNRSFYTHAGLIIDSDGTTYEAVGRPLWKITSRNFDEVYSGLNVLIARHERMNIDVFKTAFPAVEKYNGDVYPLHRLLMHTIPPLAKALCVGPGVCSEILALFNYTADLFPYWRGINPDWLEEIYRQWKGWNIIYEGVWPKGE